MRAYSVRARGALALAVFLCGASAAFSHPHVFFDVRMTVRAGVAGVEGVALEWTFDEWFSASILFDYDVDGNRSFSEAETQTVYDRAFSNLRHYDYFTYFTAGGATVPADTVQGFSVRTAGDRVVYSFFVPFEVPFDGDELELLVAVYDKTFFCDVAFHESDPVALEAPPSIRMDYAVDVDRSVAISYDNLVVGGGRPDEVYTGLAHPTVARITIEK